METRASLSTHTIFTVGGATSSTFLSDESSSLRSPVASVAATFDTLDDVTDGDENSDVGGAEIDDLCVPSTAAGIASLSTHQGRPSSGTRCAFHCHQGWYDHIDKRLKKQNEKLDAIDGIVDN